MKGDNRDIKAMDNPRVFYTKNMAFGAEFCPGAREKLVLFVPSRKCYLRFDGPTFADCVQIYLEYKRAEFDEKSRVPDFQEVIDGSTWHRIAFDLDYDIDPSNDGAYKDSVAWLREAINEIVQATCDVYFDMFRDIITPSEFVVCESLSKREPLRLSAHIIVARAIPNNRVMARITDAVIAAVPEGMRELIDRSINSTVHNLRLTGCVKPGSKRIKRLPPGAHFIDTIVSAPCARISEARAEYWINETRDVKGATCVCDVSDEDVIKACALIAGKYGNDVHRFRRRTGSLILFDRLQPSMCSSCARVHEHDSTVMVCILRAHDAVTYKEICRKNTNVEHVLETAEVPNDISLAVARVNHQPMPGEGIAAASGEGIAAMSSEGIAATSGEGSAAGEDASQNTWEQRILRREEYAEPIMRDYPPDARTVFVRAPMKLGKTKALRRYISNYAAEDTARVLIVSFRRVFTTALMQSFSEFSSYADIRGALDLPKMIVQVESLHRIVPDKLGAIDLLVLDESESIIDQFESGLSSNFGGDFAVFQWLLRTARKCIALDAYMSERTYAVVGRIRGIDDSLLVRNTYENAIDDKYFFTSNRELWILALLECIKKRERVVICSNSANEGRTLYELLAQNISFARIKFYCAETPSHIKTRDFADVNNVWTDCDVLIYTPTLTAGVSFEANHFDRLFGYFTDQSCPANVCIQMMGRVRNIATRQSYIFVQSSPGTFPTTREEMILALRLRKAAILSDVPDIEYNDAGLPCLPDTDYTELRVQNAIVRNRSRNMFARVLITMMAENGAKCAQLTRRVFADLFGYMPTMSDLRNAQAVHSDAADGSLCKTTGAIANARELTGDEYQRISARLVACNDPNMEYPGWQDDYHAVQKYDLRATYNVHEDMSASFVATYMDPGIMRAFRNLQFLCEHLARNGNNITSALTDMRRTECALLETTTREDDDGARSLREFNFTYTYETHRLAHLAAQYLGFTHVLDTCAHAIHDVEARVGIAIPRIRRNWETFRHQFKLPPMKVPLNEQLFIECAKIIFETTYCITLVRAGNIYQLAQSPLFNIRPDGSVVCVQ